MLQALLVFLPSLALRSAPTVRSGNDGTAGSPPPLWIVVPVLVTVGALVCFVQWKIWASQRAFTRKVTTPRGLVFVSGEPEDEKRPGDGLAKALIRTRPGWGRSWIVSVSGPGASGTAYETERFASRREAWERVQVLVDELSVE